MSVLTELTNGVLLITINRPEAGNSLNPEVANRLVEALRDAATNDEVRTVVVTGAGEKIFCAGMDLKAFAAGENMIPVGESLAMLASCPKPVIAAVNGHALAGGFEVTMRADLVVAVDHAKSIGKLSRTLGLSRAGLGLCWARYERSAVGQWLSYA